MVSVKVYCIKDAKEMQQQVIPYIYRCPECDTQIALVIERPSPKKPVTPT